MVISDNKTIHDIIDIAMKKRDRYVCVYFGEYGISVNVYPFIDDEGEDAITFDKKEISELEKECKERGKGSI